MNLRGLNVVSKSDARSIWKCIMKEKMKFHSPQIKYLELHLRVVIFLRSFMLIWNRVWIECNHLFPCTDLCTNIFCSFIKRYFLWMCFMLMKFDSFTFFMRCFWKWNLMTLIIQKSFNITRLLCWHDCRHGTGLLLYVKRWGSSHGEPFCSHPSCRECWLSCCSFFSTYPSKIMIRQPQSPLSVTRTILHRITFKLCGVAGILQVSDKGSWCYVITLIPENNFEYT